MAGKIPITCLLCLVLVMAALASSQPGRAQDDNGLPSIRITLDAALSPEQAAQIETLAGDLARTLDGIAAVKLEAEQADQPALETARDIPLAIEASGACQDSPCTMSLRFAVRAPAASMLLSPALQTTLLSAYGPAIEWNADVLSSAARESLVALTSGLFHYASGYCEQAIPLLDRAATGLDAAALRVQPAIIIDFYRARCHHDQRDYRSALDMLISDRHRLAEQGVGPDLHAVWDAAIADALAQNFQFDRALAWDTYAIALLRAAGDMTDSPLLAELYLLRGQHRLYLYEWDRVMADFNTALTLPGVPPRAYYFRGLLNYTENSRQAAYDDLTRYLQTETDPDSPLIPLARDYAVELAGLLATPPAQ